MNVLLTNDDGIDADGINVIYRVLKDCGHNVYMVAPEGNRSAISNKISMFGNLRLDYKGDDVWSCEGTPADCVIVAMKSDLISVKIDIVVSGINAGANIGTDIVYSGTCAAARQAALYDIPGVAVSLDKECCSDSDDYMYENLAVFTAKNLEKFKELLLSSESRAFVNINACNRKEYRGAAICNVLSDRDYNDRINISSVQIARDGTGEYVSTFAESSLVSSEEKGSDFLAAKNGYVAISVVKAEPVAINVEKDIDFIL